MPLLQFQHQAGRFPIPFSASVALAFYGEGHFEIAIGPGIHNNELEAQRARRRL
jgi:hypothetical protein